MTVVSERCVAAMVLWSYLKSMRRTTNLQFEKSDGTVVVSCSSTAIRRLPSPLVSPEDTPVSVVFGMLRGTWTTCTA